MLEVLKVPVGLLHCVLLPLMLDEFMNGFGLWTRTRSTHPIDLPNQTALQSPLFLFNSSYPLMLILAIHKLFECKISLDLVAGFVNVSADIRAKYSSSDILSGIVANKAEMAMGLVDDDDDGLGCVVDDDEGVGSIEDDDGGMGSVEDDDDEGLGSVNVDDEGVGSVDDRTPSIGISHVIGRTMNLNKQSMSYSNSNKKEPTMHTSKPGKPHKDWGF
ncbi:hypothetical protein BT96DRAFT_942039 [Gymnopus androsaceus JB14]|uniref:Uncharacterized protein n=1 Tax=Gymnopus androsaceus JB14 TaxID=1447944 RepID=A0A6A4HCI0_9AGAR|nr:hypothetical protein BT96DRAFT_942039 [Gymnopus androsaceus JB14]